LTHSQCDEAISSFVICIVNIVNIVYSKFVADRGVCVLCRDAVREVVRLLLALNARSHAVTLARQTNVSLAD